MPNIEAGVACRRVAVVAERASRRPKRLRVCMGGSQVSTVPAPAIVVDALEEDLSVLVPSTIPASEGAVRHIMSRVEVIP